MINTKYHNSEALRVAIEESRDVLNLNPSVVWYKDITLQYIGCNDAFARFTNYECSSDIELKDDYNLVWSEFAEGYQVQDKVAFEGKAIVTLDPVLFAGGRRACILTRKTPILNSQQKVIAIRGENIEVSNDHVVKQTLSLHDNDFALLGNTFNGSQTLVQRYQINNIQATKQETKVLFYYIRGYNTRHIAQLLHRSSRTIEHTIEKIRDKLLCKNKNELIDLAMKNSLYNQLPIFFLTCEKK